MAVSVAQTQDVTLTASGLEEGATAFARLPTLLGGRGGNQNCIEEGEKVVKSEPCVEKTSEFPGSTTAEVAAGRPEDVDQVASDEDYDEEDEGSSQVRQERAAQSEALWTAIQQSLQDRERIERVWAFLRKHGFKGVNSSKGWAWSYTYPLHCAAELNDVAMVRLLLESHAIRRQRDSSGKTARQVAKAASKNGSHFEVTEALLPKKLQEQRAARRKEEELRRRRPAMIRPGHIRFGQPAAAAAPAVISATSASAESDEAIGEADVEFTVPAEEPSVAAASSAASGGAASPGSRGPQASTIGKTATGEEVTFTL